MDLCAQSDIRYLKGVGEKRAALYNKLNIYTVGDLLGHYPRSYLDLSAPVTITAAPLGEIVAVQAVVLKNSGEQRIRRGMSLYKLVVSDNSATLTITFFNAKYTADQLKPGNEYIFYGKISGDLLKREMTAPLVFPADATAALVPVYPLTAGLSNKSIGTHISRVLASGLLIPEPLPENLRAQHQLCAMPYALAQIHHPRDAAAAATARRRLCFEELLVLTLGLTRLKSDCKRASCRALSPVDLTPFISSLPYRLTEAQLRCIDEIVADLATSAPMNRLVQGDVGSGKTVVSAACIYHVAQNGGQAALMAPTEILAQQHYATMQAMLSPLGVTVALLTGSTKAPQKRQIRQGLASGQITLCVGTHALIGPEVAFNSLDLVVTDEQHRFGVSQRLKLQEKGRNTNTLVMSATPIPRTLAIMIYGDLDLSILDQLPPGRTPIETYQIESSKRLRAFGFLQKHMDMGRQAYIVCPLIEQDEENPSELTAVGDYAQDLAKGPFAAYTVGVLHGKLKPKEKEAIMARFAAGEIQLLIATTVIEVGVDVPNAVIMMIENAERFGLSQLHQLRGRVGRGKDKSYCILVSDAKGDTSRTRLGVMCRSGDGFEIAREDLKLRGPGDFFGARQHGLPLMKLADLTADALLLKEAQAAAEMLLRHSPDLQAYPLLAAAVEKLWQQVGQRPN